MYEEQAPLGGDVGALREAQWPAVHLQCHGSVRRRRIGGISGAGAGGLDEAAIADWMFGLAPQQLHHFGVIPGHRSAGRMPELSSVSAV